jgi:hypothetical protein
MTTDTPIPEPPSTAETVKGFIGDLARPFALMWLAGFCGVALIMEGVPSDKLGLALTALGAMYAAKSIENASTAKQSSLIGVAQAHATAPPPPPAPIVTPVVAAAPIAPQAPTP